MLQSPAELCTGAAFEQLVVITSETMTLLCGSQGCKMTLKLPRATQQPSSSVCLLHNLGLRAAGGAGVSYDRPSEPPLPRVRVSVSDSTGRRACMQTCA